MYLMTDAVTDTGAGPILKDAQRFWRLPPQQLYRLLALTRQVDCVELKLVVPEAAHESACSSLGVDLCSVPARTVYFLDTPDLTLERAGIVVRIRSFRNKPDDSVIKLRPVSPVDLRSGRKRLVAEIDAMPGGFVCSGAMKRHLGKRDVERVMTKGRSLRKLFTNRQVKLLTDHVPVPVRVDDLEIFGPVDVHRVKIRPDGLGRTLSVERWTYPDGSRILELSTRCRAKVAVPVAAEFAAMLQAYDIDISGYQQTKTRATLAYFGRVREGCGAGRPAGHRRTRPPARIRPLHR